VKGISSRFPCSEALLPQNRLLAKEVECALFLHENGIGWRFFGKLLVNLQRQIVIYLHAFHAGLRHD